MEVNVLATRILRGSDDDESLLRRLGGAIVVQWSNLPNDIRKVLLAQAVLMEEPKMKEGDPESQLDRYIWDMQPNPLWTIEYGTGGERHRRWIRF